MFDWTPIFTAAITASIAAFGTFIAHENRKSERVKRTCDLYNQFFTIPNERSIAWYWLEELEQKGSACGFEGLWRLPENKEKYHALYRVLSFWFLVHRLDTSGQLDDNLARSLLGYEFYYWQKQVYSLVQRTNRIDRVFPDVLEPFESVDWFLPQEALPKAARLVRG